MNQESIHQARALLCAHSSGVLSTISAKLEGFPFGSVVPYSLDGQGMPVILISTIAEHTKNLIRDPRCSITIAGRKGDVQAKGRLCIVGDMVKLAKTEQDVMERYYAHFPRSRGYHSTHDFAFYHLKPVAARYIGGFGAIHRRDVASLQTRNPLQGEAERRAIDHMNADHAQDLRLYCSHFKKMSVPSGVQVRMVGIDSWGFDVFIDDEKLRFDFESPIADVNGARAQLVAMSKAAKTHE